MKASKVLEVATYAGRIILENGGETYRVEDTVCRICEAYGFEAQCFATITGIISSVKNREGIPVSLTERITTRTTNLDKIHKVNAVAREISNFSTDELMSLFRRIDNGSTYSETKAFIAHSLGAASFAGMFGGTPKDFFGAFIIGGGIYFLKRLSDKMELNPYLMYSAGGCLASVVSILFSRINLITSVDTTTIGSIMLLVPGMAITNAIRDIIAGDLVAGMARGAEALIIATCLAIGSGIALSTLLN